MRLKQDVPRKHPAFFSQLKFNAMPKQTGIVRLEGLVDDFSYYKSKDGSYRLRRKGGVSAERIAKDPAFRKLRATTSDFTKAANAGKLLRDSIGPLLKQATDTRMVSRLTKEMFKVLQADQTNESGMRKVIDGEAELLRGFEFNANATLSTVFGAVYTPSIDRVSGVLKVDFGSFIPDNAFVTPENCTHYAIKIGGVAIDFENRLYITDRKASDQRKIEDESPAFELVCQLPAGSPHPLFLLVGVEFFSKEKVANAKLHKEHSNPLAIVLVSGM